MLLDLGEVETIETPRLRLTLPELRHFEDLAAIMADPEVVRFLGGRPQGREQTWRGLAAMVGHWALLGYGMHAVEEKRSGRCIGRIGLIHFEGWPALELGWTLARGAWGRGYAFEAASTLRAYWLERLRPHRLISIIHLENERSASLARRLGAVPGEATVFAGDPVHLWEHPLEVGRPASATGS